MAILSSDVNTQVEISTSQPSISFADTTSLAEAGATWQRLETSIQNPSITCSWKWTQTWLKHFGTQLDWRIVTGSVDGEIIGIALVTASLPFPGPRLGFRGLLHIGTSGEKRADRILAENNRLLAIPALESIFAAQLVSYLKQRYRPIGIRFEAFSTTTLKDLLANTGKSATVEPLPCPIFDLDKARMENQDVLALLGGGVRGRIRRSDRGYGEIRAEWATNEAQALDIFDELAELHQERWHRAGVPGAFGSKPFCDFHRDIIRQAFQDGSPILLFRLRSHEGTIGCLYSFIENGDVLFYQSGFAEATNNRLKPGLSTHAACMQECLNRGLRTYNFLAGDSRYKRELSTGEMMLQTVILYRFAWIPQLLDLLVRLGVKDRARSVKHWLDRRAIASATKPEDQQPAS